MKHEIDFFELCFLAEACIPPTPIARAHFWERFTFEIWNDLSIYQRNRAYEWLMKHPRLQYSIEAKNEDALLFEARYNPENQYIVRTVDGNTHEAFLHKGCYYVDNGKSIIDEHIQEVKVDERYKQ